MIQARCNGDLTDIYAQGSVADELFAEQSQYASQGKEAAAKQLKADIKVIGIRHGEKLYETL